MRAFLAGWLTMALFPVTLANVWLRSLVSNMCPGQLKTTNISNCNQQYSTDAKSGVHRKMLICPVLMAKEGVKEVIAIP